MTTPPAHLRAMRRQNLSAVLLALARSPGSRTELSRRIGLTKATVASLVEPLLERGVLAEDLAAPSGRGRPSRTVAFGPDAPVTVGVEIGVGAVSGTVHTLDGQELTTATHPIANAVRPVTDLVADVAAVVAAAVESAVEDRDVLGVGVAVPGVVREGRVVRAPNLPHLVGADLAAALAGATGRPVWLDNEANLTAWAHLWPRPLAGPDVVYVSSDVGIGAGIVLDGRLYRGATGFAGELGHVVVEQDGRRCTCGGRGCVEQYAGLAAILRAAGRRRADSLERTVRAGDPRAVRALTHGASALGVAVASLVNLFDVREIVLGGVYGTLFDVTAPAIERELSRRVLAATERPITVHPSRRPGPSAAHGAAALVGHHACLEPAGLLAI